MAQKMRSLYTPSQAPQIKLLLPFLNSLYTAQLLTEVFQ
jgi:hypothetical protein